MSNTLKAALAYAAKGWDVFPAPVGEKKSHKKAAHSGGAKWGKTRDPDQIKRDFAKWPNANVGIPTGPDNGFWVMETDTPKGKGDGVDGQASLNVLIAKHGPLPATLMAISPSGSIHYYWAWPLEFPISTKAGHIGHGVDQRGKGGMVIAPPSRRKDGVYRWLNDLPIAYAPMWLVELARKGVKERAVQAVQADQQQVPDYLDDETDASMAAYEITERLDDATAMVEELEYIEPTLPEKRIPYDLFYRAVAAIQTDVGIAGYPLVVRLSKARSYLGSRAGQSPEQIAKDAWRDTATLKDIHLGSIYYHTRKLEDGDEPEDDDDEE